MASELGIDGLDTAPKLLVVFAAVAVASADAAVVVVVAVGVALAVAALGGIASALVADALS
eukprot:3392247-Prorocentrum_lima.AAC.1